MMPGEQIGWSSQYTTNPMEAIKRRARVRHNHLEWTDASPDLPDGDVEVILLYTKQEAAPSALSVTEWPVLDGGAYRGGTMRREDLYGEHGR